MLVLLFLYAGYIALAQASARDGGSSKLPAIFGIVGAINIPIINRSVVWWNSLHQPPSLTAGKSAIDAEFLVPLLISVLGFSLLFGGIVLMRMMHTSFFLSRQTLLASDKPGMPIWREKIFAWMLRNAASAMEFFRLPTNRVVELGSQVEI